MSHASSRSRTTPQPRRQSMTSALLSPISKGEAALPSNSSSTSVATDAKAAASQGLESPPRARQDVSSFIGGNCTLLMPRYPGVSQLSRVLLSMVLDINTGIEAAIANLHTACIETVPNIVATASRFGAHMYITCCTKLSKALPVEPTVFRLLDDNGQEVGNHPYEHLSGVQVEGNGLALIIYKPDTPAYAYFFTSESTAPVAAALEQRRRKRPAAETGKRVADTVSLPSGGPLTFTEAKTAVETLPIRGLAILRTENSVEFFSFERHTLWSVVAPNQDDLSTLFTALLQMNDPPVVTALGEQSSTTVDILLALHAATLKTTTVNLGQSVRTVLPLVGSDVRPSSREPDKPLRLENRAMSFSPPRASSKKEKERQSVGGLTNKQRRRQVVSDLVPQEKSPLRKPTKTLVRLICQREGFAFVDALFRAISPASAEAERVVKGVVILQCAMGKGGDYAAHLARQEIASLGPSDYPSLFRANTMGTKALILFCRRQGATFFQRALRPALAQLLDFPKPVEIDTSRDPKLPAAKNANNLRALVQQFIDGLLGSTDSMPSSVMATIREEVEKKWPSKGPHAVGCLLFLRLVCPVIIAPEQFGLAPAPKITAAARRALVLVSKVIQAMLSEMQGQAKEAYMAPLDSWIGERRGVVYSYAVALSRLPETRKLQGRAPVAEDPPAKEDLVGSFIALQNTFATSEKIVLTQLQAHPKDSARFSRAVKEYAATQIGVPQKKP